MQINQKPIKTVSLGNIKGGDCFKMHSGAIHMKCWYTAIAVESAVKGVVGGINAIPIINLENGEIGHAKPATQVELVSIDAKVV